MIVEVDLREEPAAAHLLEPQDFKGLKLVVVDTGPAPASRLREAGISRLEEHAWVPVDVLRALAGADATAEWEESLSAMIEYAAGRGWVDDERSAIRAHIERRSV